MSILTIGTSEKQDACTSRRPYFERIRSTHSCRSSISHPQLRDLLICPTQAHHVQTVSGHGIDAHVFGRYTMPLMENPTTFFPNCLVSGCGYVAMGGETADLLIRSVDIKSRWELKIFTGQSIVNSVCFYQVSKSSNPQLLVCNNDQTITQYDLSVVSSIQDAAMDSLSADPAHRPTNSNPAITSRRHAYTDESSCDESDSISTANEKPIMTHKSSIVLPVPVNHCSVSPDKKSMVAVGDSNEVFIYDCDNTFGSNEPLINDWRLRSRKVTLPGVSASVGSFSTSWNQYGDKFAVASEGEVVVVYDMRMLPKPLLVKHTTQKGRSGAARVVKFSPEGPNELLAFIEHQSLVHVLDARTFDPDHEETLTVPTPLPGMSPFPPRLASGSILNDSSLPSSSSSRRSSHSSLGFGHQNFPGSSRFRLRRLRGNHSARNNPSVALNNPDEERTEEHVEQEHVDEHDEEVEDPDEEEEEAEEQEGRQEDRESTRVRLLENMGPASSSGMSIESPADSRIIERLWGEMQGDDDRSGQEAFTSLISSRSRENRPRPRYRWAFRSGLLNSEDDEACLDFDGTSTNGFHPLVARQLPPLFTISNPTIFAEIQSNSMRILNNNLERRSNRSPLRVQHRAGSSATISGIHSHLINNGLGRRSNLQNESWFDGGNTTNNNQAHYHTHQQHLYSSVRSGMWDDLIGLSWSPDGEWLVSGTEAGLVEWKVKRLNRTGFGDARLC
ncbi:hypothetical protein O181_058786 [Austropuccinia psidii MF-1]|uniref:DUF2415 domain-containing protein n=1 Tax=Austropuccinia psidii MF-1 TaxID=1389203 RepID=A0A9Q3HV61_9BASI|nr:hypothetical protein [Austropuccinia psidii MF-1]